MKESGNQILVGTLDHGVCVKVEGKGTHLNSQPLREFLSGMIDEGYRSFHLDLRGCTYMDSTFLGMLVGVSMRLRSVNADKMAISQISPRNMELFQTLGIEQFFRIESESQPSAANPDHLQSLPNARLGSEQWAETMLEAHETLAQADQKNVCRFKDVITFLKEDLARIREARESGTEGSDPARH